MKKILTIVLTLGCFYFSEAQVNRGIGTSQYRNSLPDRKEKKEDPIEKSMNYLDKELNLDTFQKAAIRTLLEENKDENSKTMASSYNDAEKTKRIEESREKLNKKVASVLNPEQVEKFEKIKDNDRKNNKESRKKIKKSRKDKEEQTEEKE